MRWKWILTRWGKGGAMKPVYQKPNDGLCFGACIATLLGVELRDVPVPPPTDNEDPTPYWNALRKWLRGRGYALVRIDGKPASHGGAPIIVGGPSPRGTAAGHSVIMNGYRMLHDPHPDNTGITAIEECYLLVPLKPWRVNR